MKRWRLLLIALMIALPALALRTNVRATAKRKREIGYEAALRSYSQTIHPGLTRKDLEDYLRSRNISFTWAFTSYGASRDSQYADLVKLGEEASPLWSCGQEYVYVAFVFKGVEKYRQNDSDVLERIEEHRPADCL